MVCDMAMDEIFASLSRADDDDVGCCGEVDSAVAVRLPAAGSSMAGYYDGSHFEFAVRQAAIAADGLQLARQLQPARQLSSGDSVLFRVPTPRSQ